MKFPHKKHSAVRYVMLLFAILGFSYVTQKAMADPPRLSELVSQRSALASSLGNNFNNFLEALTGLRTSAGRILQVIVADEARVAEIATPILRNPSAAYSPIRAALTSAALRDAFALLSNVPERARGAARDPRVLKALEEWLTLSEKILVLETTDPATLSMWSSSPEIDRKLAQVLLTLYRSVFATQNANVLLEDIEKDFALRFNQQFARGLIANASHATTAQRSRVVQLLVTHGATMSRALSAVLVVVPGYQLSTCMVDDQGKRVKDVSFDRVINCAIIKEVVSLFDLASLSFGHEAQAAEDLDGKTTEGMLSALRAGGFCETSAVPGQQPWCYPLDAFAKLIVKKPQAAGLLAALGQKNPALHSQVQTIFSMYAHLAPAYPDQGSLSAAALDETRKIVQASINNQNVGRATGVGQS